MLFFLFSLAPFTTSAIRTGGENFGITKTLSQIGKSMTLQFASRNRVNDEPKEGYHSGPDGRMWVYVWFLSLKFVVCHLFSTQYNLLMDAISVSNHQRGLTSTDVLLYTSDLFGLLRNWQLRFNEHEWELEKNGRCALNFSFFTLECCGTQVNNVERKIRFDLWVSSLQKLRKKKCIDPNGKRKFCWDLVSSEILWQMCMKDTIARIHARRKLVQAAAVKIDFWYLHENDRWRLSCWYTRYLKFRSKSPSLSQDANGMPFPVSISL